MTGARGGKAVPKRAPLTGRRSVFFNAGINLRRPARCANVPSAGSEDFAVVQKISSKVDPRSVQGTGETPNSRSRVVNFRAPRDLGRVSLEPESLNSTGNDYPAVR